MVFLWSGRAQRWLQQPYSWTTGRDRRRTRVVRDVPWRCATSKSRCQSFNWRTATAAGFYTLLPLSRKKPDSSTLLLRCVAPPQFIDSHCCVTTRCSPSTWKLTVRLGMETNWQKQNNNQTKLSSIHIWPKHPTARAGEVNILDIPLVWSTRKITWTIHGTPRCFSPRLEKNS